MTAKTRGALWSLIAGAALISTTGVLVRYADVAPTVSAFWRMAFGGVMLAGFLAVARQWRPAALRDWGWMLAPAVFFALDLFLWHRSIHEVGPGLATLLANFQVFVMALAGVLLHRERLGPRFLGGLALAFGGLWLLVGVDWGGFDARYRLGVVFGLLTGLAYAAYMLSFRHAQRERSTLPAPQLLAMNSLLCAAVLAAAVTGEGASFAIPDAGSLCALLALGLVGQCLGWVLIASAMPRLPASVVGLVLLLQPSLAFVQDVLLFDRATRSIEWLGVALSLAGIFLGTLKANPGKP
ncbi:DMT family transporter [Rehaibacterium terrae]|jgi:drug/metabolite transporter (DMT)-like permease|uniref:Drug/metabolite transporter (DMT)-like permease n=1 Tax=Rehaibacterium terrae TaxID=1341696 RepID=A0A7W8DFS6_9GAMM|nr:DMT family transporter [Rehaibacterium terrae]MBB5016519.1 drug/metabolite transporter (DMT)-like permease [Rehaibacterium terrae]